MGGRVGLRRLQRIHGPRRGRPGAGGRAVNAGVDQVLTHECPAGLCTEQVDPDMLTCPRHWHLVPRPLRRAVWIAWRRGAGAGSPAHRAAMRAAIAAVNRAYARSLPDPATFRTQRTPRSVKAPGR